MRATFVRLLQYKRGIKAVILVLPYCKVPHRYTHGNATHVCSTIEPDFQRRLCTVRLDFSLQLKRRKYRGQITVASTHSIVWRVVSNKHLQTCVHVNSSLQAPAVKEETKALSSAAMAQIGETRAGYNSDLFCDSSANPANAAADIAAIEEDLNHGKNRCSTINISHTWPCLVHEEAGWHLWEKCSPGIAAGRQGCCGQPTSSSILTSDHADDLSAHCGALGDAGTSRWQKKKTLTVTTNVICQSSQSRITCR